MVFNARILEELLNSNPKEIAEKYPIFVGGFVIILITFILYFLFWFNPLYGFIIGILMITFGFEFPSK